MNDPRVIIDTRERKPFQLEFYGYNVIHKKLHTCDYSIEGLENFITIDRKASISEVVQNLFYGYTRFKKEMIRCLDIENAFLVLEFPFEYVSIFPHSSGIPKRKWQGLRATTEGIINKLDLIYTSYGVKTIFCDSRLEAEQVTVKLLNKAINGEGFSDVDFFRKGNK